MKNPNWIDLDAGKMNAKDYFHEVGIAFPQLLQELNWYEFDASHPKMEVFARYTNLQIEDDNDAELIKCFQFQEDRLDKVNSDLENAFYVSYCETLFFENTADVMKVKKELMPQQFRHFYDEYEAAV